ncbi:BTB/POZ and MATH domain-containing protein 3-like [Lolium perenne]|uniref:BTB/POZ and MATH domain-containing protein 3-like n=1 Tax=Lolium perenne TaxID=4522 RepID=UPI0021F50289|nr:BTB/POZ and MATH domain-containing protein 3-like [Lolium perenne]
MSSSGGGMLPRTASAVVATSMTVSHDMVISGYSTTKMCYFRGTYIKSAKFVAGGRRWYLRYYPNGCSPKDYGSVTFLLYHDRDAAANEDEVPVVYQIFLLGPDGNPVPEYKSTLRMIYAEPSNYGLGFITNKALEESAYLRDDAFSVRCEFRVPIIDRRLNEEAPPNSPTPTHVPADVHEGLIRFISDDVPTDVSLEVGDETFRAHRRFLAAQSPVFAALFTGPMRENTAPSVRIHDMEPQVFKAMLDFIYRGNLPPAVDQGDDGVAMTQHLLVAADRYDLERLKSVCSEKLRLHISTSSVAATLELAHRHGCPALRDACYNFLAPPKGNLKAILKSGGFEQLIIDYPSVVVELLARVAPSPH